MGKCTFCQDRLLEAQTPACAAACPTGALGVEQRPVTLGEPVFPGLFQGGLGPSLRIAPAAIPMAPAMAATAEGSVWLSDPSSAPVRKTSFRSEWTLWLFTLGCMGLVGLHLGWTWGGPRLLTPWLFLVLGGLAAGFSTSHLGRPQRAWCAARNLGTSWLSREALGFGVFLPLAAFSQILGVPSALAGLSAVAGLLFLVAIDRLYQVAERRPFWKFRSAEVLFAGVHLAALVATALPGLVLLSALRSLLFLAEYLRLQVRDRNSLAAAMRLAALLLPAVAIASRIPVPIWSVLALFLAGEAVDRFWFYQGLGIPSPTTLLEREESISGCVDPA
jgi:DMSO reductase anchor subunit